MNMIVFWPLTIENRAALRTAFAALIAILISFKFHLQTPYWSGMSVIIVSNLYTGSIIDKAMMRIIGTVAGAVVGFYIAGFIANSFLLYLLSCFLIVTLCVYYYNFSSYAYAYLLAALSAFIVISQIAFTPQNAFLVAIWRPVEIGIGVLVSAVCAYSIFPNHLKNNVAQQLDEIFVDFSRIFNLLEQDLENKDADFSVLATALLDMKKKLRKAIELIGAMRREIGVSKEDIDKIRGLLDSFYDVCRHTQYMMIRAREHNANLVIPKTVIGPVFEAIKSDLAQIELVFDHKTHQTITLSTKQASENLAIIIHKNKKSKWATDTVTLALVSFLSQLDQHFSSMRMLLFSQPNAQPMHYQVLNTKDRLRSDIDLIKHSVKAGLSVLLALSFWLVSNWPGGLNGIISSLIISIRKSLFDMKYISIHRVLGCFAGGGVALTSMSYFSLNLYDFIMIVFLSVWFFSYCTYKFPNYSYIGLQANLALIIAMAQQGGPPVDLAPPLQRIGGIFIGIVASFLVANVLWRQDVITVLKRYVGKLFGYMTYNMNQVLLVSGGQKSLHDLSNLFWNARGMIESLTNEQLNDKKLKQLDRYRNDFERLVIVQATLSHLTMVLDREVAHGNADQYGINLIDVEQKVVRYYQKRDKKMAEILLAEITSWVTDLENKMITPAKLGLDNVPNLIGYLVALKQLLLCVG